jgi:hypothetical protein
MPWAGIKSQVKPLPEKYINLEAHQNLYMQHVQPGGNTQPNGPYFKIPHFMNIPLIFHISISFIHISYKTVPFMYHLCTHKMSTMPTMLAVAATTNTIRKNRNIIQLLL